MLHPVSRFAIALKDGRKVQLAWDFAAIFAEEQARLRGEKVSVLLTLFFMTRSVHNPPSLEDLREAAKALGKDGLLELLKAIGATKSLAITGGLAAAPAGEAKSTREPWDWRKAIVQAASQLDLSLDEFWRLTPFEYLIGIEAAAGKRRFGAAMTANLLNVLGRLKHPVTVDQLLGLEEQGKFTDQMDEGERAATVQNIGGKVERLRAEGKLKERPADVPAAIGANGEQTTPAPAQV